MSLSTELAFEDFLKSRNPSRVMRERITPTLDRVRTRIYDDTTDTLTQALRNDSRMEIEFAFRTSDALLASLSTLAGHGTARKGHAA